MAGALILLLLILAIYIPLTTYAQTTNEISATTNKSTYKIGEKIVITGTVEKPEGIPVTILIRNPIQNVYNVGQIDLSGNVFIHDFVISDTSKPGLYTVEIKYGTQKIMLEFIVNVGLIQTISIGNTAIKVMGDEIGVIKYKDAQISTQENSITIDVDTLTVTDLPIMQEFEIPKQVIDAPESLIVEVNGALLNCSETKTNIARILNCLIPPDARVLKITGTSVIPEFGSVTVVILLISMTIVALSTRIKQRKSF